MVATRKWTQAPKDNQKLKEDLSSSIGVEIRKKILSAIAKPQTHKKTKPNAG